MKYEIFIYVGYIGGILGAVSCIYLFVKLNIKKAFGDLTGLTTKKELKELHKKTIQQAERIRNFQNQKSETIVSHDTVLLSIPLEKKKLECMEEESDSTVCLMENGNEETTILVGDKIRNKNFLEQEQKSEENFVIFTDVTVIHTDETL